MVGSSRGGIPPPLGRGRGTRVSEGALFVAGGGGAGGVGDFLHHGKLADPDLGVVVVDGDGDDVGGVDPADEGALPTELAEVLVAAHVETVRAGALGVVVHQGAVHGMGGAHGVAVGLAGVHVVVVVLDLLVEEEVALGGDGDLVGGDEAPELVAAPHRGVGEDLVEEGEEGADGQPLLVEVEDVGDDGVIHGGPTTEDGVAHDLHGALHEGGDAPPHEAGR